VARFEKLGSGNGWSAVLGKVVSQLLMLGDWGSRCWRCGDLEACEERSVVCICFIKPAVKILVVKRVMRMIELLLACLMTRETQVLIFLSYESGVVFEGRSGTTNKNDLDRDVVGCAKL